MTPDETIADLQARLAAAEAQATAIGEVMAIITDSPGNLAPVFDAMLDKAMRLCGPDFGLLRHFDGERLHVLVSRGMPSAYADYLAAGPHAPEAAGRLADMLATGRPLMRADIRDSDPYRAGNEQVRAIADLAGARTMLHVPLMKDQVAIGAFTFYRQEVRVFSDKEIALLESFAAQAVIAMENARLLTEQQEALERQTATAEVLEVINANPGDLGPVFDSILEMAHRLCGAERGSLQLREGNWIRAVATRGFPAEVANVLRRGQPIANAAGLHLNRVNQIEDQRPLLAARPDSEMLRATVGVAGTRTALAIPLLKDGVFLGRIMAGRTEVRRFTDKQIALLESFAAQAVIAMENARLITEIRAARDNAETSLHDLKIAQANLIQAEKMASLGQLTAGIAHEIKNPLNFVNNFADLSVELLAELRDVIAPALASLNADARADADDLSQALTSNLQKITEHGKRADGIVRGMLEHSRGASGERRAVDLNDLVEEALNLSYHGARAQDQSFNITLERDYAPGIAPIMLNPQDITRVFVNLFGNGFYAAKQRAKTETMAPTLKVTTSDLGHAVEIRVRDNGTGIPPDISDKLFEPFFTTKPTGEGTGLGLSITYDIVTKQHAGSIAVASELGAYTEFTVTLPRTNTGVSP